MSGSSLSGDRYTLVHATGITLDDDGAYSFHDMAILRDTSLVEHGAFPELPRIFAKGLSHTVTGMSLSDLVTETELPSTKDDPILTNDYDIKALLIIPLGTPDAGNPEQDYHHANIMVVSQHKSGANDWYIRCERTQVDTSSRDSEETIVDKVSASVWEGKSADQNDTSQGPRQFRYLGCIPLSSGFVGSDVYATIDSPDRRVAIPEEVDSTYGPLIWSAKDPKSPEDIKMFVKASVIASRPP